MPFSRAHAAPSVAPMIRTELPPTITPTLPNATTTPSGLIVPGSAAPDAPQPGTTTTTTPGGLIVVRNELSPVTKGAELVVSDQPLTGDMALDAAKAAHAELAARDGAPVADIMLGAQLEMVQDIRNDELRHEAIEALLAGDLGRAAELMSRAD